jgi:carbohydrate kinase (thermoresistant glucokinase family)
VSGSEGTPPILVVLGVSGSGKSTVGALIARELGVPFVDADSLHPPANVAKMAAGSPLTDDDRWPWLARVSDVLAEAAAAGDGMVVGCSALKRVYRDAIRVGVPGLRFVHLNGTREVLALRTQGRVGHFMPASLLDSQLATLEPLHDDEPGIEVDIAPPVADVVADAIARLRAPAPAGSD